jgi:hypothetical protein
VQKLIKAKYQDNLEFLQWIKRYYDLHYPGGKYNAVERRKEAKCILDGEKQTGAQEAPAPQQSALPTAPKRVEHKPVEHKQAEHKQVEHKQENPLNGGK